jgi:hypothetical protein
VLLLRRRGYPCGRRAFDPAPPQREGDPIVMATDKQRAAAKRNVRQAQAGAKKKQTLKNLPAKTRTALGKEAAAVRRGDEPTRSELEAQARTLDIKGRSKMGKAELKRAVAQAKGG